MLFKREYQRRWRIVLVLFLGGCVSVSYYQPPAGGEKAMVTFRLLQMPSHGLHFYADGIQCVGTLYVRQEMLKQFAGDKPEPIAIPANKEFAYEFSNLNGTKWCVIGQSFFPEPGARYRVTWDYDKDKGECSSIVRRVVIESGIEKETVEASLKRRQMRRRTPVSDSECVPL